MSLKISLDHGSQNLNAMKLITATKVEFDRVIIVLVRSGLMSHYWNSPAKKKPVTSNSSN